MMALINIPCRASTVALFLTIPESCEFVQKDTKDIHYQGFTNVFQFGTREKRTRKKNVQSVKSFSF